MSNFMDNRSKGRAVEYQNRVDSNDPANSAFILVPLSASGTEAQGQDLHTLAAYEADANFAERTTGGWVRKVLTDAELAAIAVDDTNNRFPVVLPQVTWVAPATGNNTTGLLLCYDSDTAAGADANIEVIAHFDFVVNTDGNDVVLNAGDAIRAS